MAATAMARDRRRELEQQAAAWRRRRPEAGRPAGRRPWAQGVSVWCGYRLIGLGSRLLRPALTQLPAGGAISAAGVPSPTLPPAAA